MVDTKRSSFLALVAAFMLMPREHFAADLVYDNGSPNLLNGFELTHWKEANSFTINAGVVLSAIRFWDIEASASFQSEVDWEIRADNGNAPGPILFSGASANPAHVATGRKAFAVYPEFVNDCGVPSISLPAGSYWLVLHNGPPSNNTGRDIFWESATSINLVSSSSDVAPFANNWQTNGTVSQMAFQFTGVLESNRPRITSIATGGRMVRITFTTVSGQHYRVEFSNSLTQPAWTTVLGAADVPGTGGEVQIADNDPVLAGIKQRFYRVVLL